MKKIILLTAACSSFVFFCEAKKKKKLEPQLRTDIEFLASDALQGRATGTMGEKLAAQYIADRLKQIGVAPLWNNSYMQTYTVADGKLLGENHCMVIAGDTLQRDDFAALPIGTTGEVSELVLPTTQEQGGLWLVAASSITKKNLSNPHDEALQVYETAIKDAIARGAKGIVVYNDIDADHDYEFLPTTKWTNEIKQPILFINYSASQKKIVPHLSKDFIDIYANVDVRDKMREGRNVGAFINNNASKTVIIGAHFDHLGYGDDHNSLYTGKDRQIHNGADDNASGTAAMLALASLLHNGKYTNSNYMLLSFSGEELGLYGSKRFTEMNETLLANANYMINIDMLGRFDAEKNSLTIGGVGTSPTFIPTIEKSKPFFTPKYDSAGVGPSDHTSFYLKNMPVLFFFTGLHSDYHKPTDDVEKINFAGEEKIVHYIHSLIGKLNKEEKLAFTKTKEPKMEGARFKVTLGIMPDYTYSGNGVKADGITDGKPAKKAGLQAGDVIVQLGDTKVVDMQAYMQALSKFKKGDSTKVKVQRKDSELELNVVFE